MDLFNFIVCALLAAAHFESDGFEIMTKMQFESRTLIKWCHNSTLQIIHVYKHDFNRTCFILPVYLIFWLCSCISFRCICWERPHVVLEKWQWLFEDRWDCSLSVLHWRVSPLTWSGTVQQHGYSTLFSLLLCIHTMKNVISLSCLVLVGH